MIKAFRTSCLLSIIIISHNRIFYLLCIDQSFITLLSTKFAGRNLCYIDNIAFLFAAVVVVVIAVIVAAVADDLSVLDNHGVHWYLDLMVSSYLFFH
jgi:hypothetical protein